ncbi:hypothetical protein [Halosimplex halobium]|uniref:hypothetical protein n=1 Tax=Halosimplex halobium TaxID=3396618 RepID=UPI003F573B22
MAKDDDIHIAITSERKQRWQEFVEEDENIDSLTELVRHGVEGHIERAQAGGSGDGGVEVDWEPVLQPLQELQQGMEQAVDGIDEINERVSETSEIAELADTIYPLLPEASSPSELDDARKELPDDATHKDKAMATGDARHFAELWDRDLGTVMQAQTFASNENPEVQINDTGETMEAYIYTPEPNPESEPEQGENR